MPNPFTNQSMIENRAQFFGRQQELSAVFNQLKGSTPNNCNVFGERRLGRSSILWHIKTIAPERLGKQFENFRFTYVDLRPNESPEALFARLARGWDSDLPDAPATLSKEQFERVLADIKRNGRTAVALMDELETLAHNPAFKNFWGSLHSWISTHLLIIIISTRQPLNKYELTYPNLSTLHGKCHPVPLGLFKEADAIDLITQPNEHGFDKSDALFAIKHADLHPLHLNLLASEMWLKRSSAGGVWNDTLRKSALQEYKTKLALIKNPKPQKNIIKSIVAWLKRASDWAETRPNNILFLGYIVAAIVVIVALLLGYVTFSELVSRFLGIPSPTP